MISKSYFPIVLLVFSFMMNGCQLVPTNGPEGPTPPEFLPPGSTNNVPDNGNKKDIAAYTLKAGDPIFIRFSGVSDQSALDVVIDEKGELNLLHLEQPVKAGGLTTSQLEDKIEKLYIESGIYVNLSVNVTMTAKTYFVQGEVNRSGKFELTGGMTIRQAIVAAGDYTPFANKKKVTLTRQDNVYYFNMKDIAKDPSGDVLIEANDIIFVPKKLW